MGCAFSILPLIASLTMSLGLLISSSIAEKIGVHVWFFVSGIGTIFIVGIIIFIDKIIRKSKNENSFL